VYFPASLQVLNAHIIKDPNIHPTFLLLLYQNIICWVITSLLFLIAAKICLSKGTRIIDFFGTVGLSRFPFLIITFIIFVIQLINPNFMNIDLTKMIPVHPQFSMMVFGIVVSICGVWQIITYFYALKESSGLAGKKLWISFIVTMILADLISSQLTTLGLA
jgi:hypothetical protein